MPTDATASDTPMRDERKGLRLALGVAGIFIIAMAVQWRFAFLSAVFAAIFLQAPAAPSISAGLKFVLIAVVLLVFGYAAFSILLPYRPTCMIAQVLLLMWAFYLSVTGKPPLLVVLALLEAVMMPFLVHRSLDVAWTFARWLPANMAFALLATWCAFSLVPTPTDATAPAAAKPELNFDKLRRLVRMTMVTAPFIILFFMFDGGAVVTLIFVAILSYQLAASTAEGPKVAKAMLLASLIGGAMAPFGNDIDVKILGRLFQLAVALAWVLLSFVAVDEIRPERKHSEE